MASVGHLKRIWKDAFSVAGAVHETCSSKMLASQGADFLRDMDWKNRKTHWYEAVSSALSLLIIEGRLADLLRF